LWRLKSSDEELNNDISKSYSVRKRKLNKYDLESLERFKNKEHVMCMSYILFQDLCNKEIIAEGKYIVDISW